MFLVTTTQRCGSTWLTRILERMTGSASGYVDGRELGFRVRAHSEEGAPEILAGALRSLRPAEVFKTHDIPSKDFDGVCAALPELRLLTVSRDFKDVIVSRYFYYRYYWPSDPTLGSFPQYLMDLFASFKNVPDRAALAQLIESPELRAWAEEWAAFEGAFATPNALRVRYSGLLDDSERSSLEAFTGRPFPRLASFEAAQEAETADTGRAGRTRFYRRGQCGQWREWFTGTQGRALDLSVGRLLSAKPDQGAHDLRTLRGAELETTPHAE